MDNLNHIYNALKSEIQKYGMTPPDTFKIGEITRFSDNGKPNNKDGWYILFKNLDDSAVALFGNYKGVNDKWIHQPNGKSLSQKQQKKH